MPQVGRTIGSARRLVAGAGAALAARTRSRTPLATQIYELIGEPADVAVRAFDGSRAGPAEPGATLVFVRPEALTRLLSSPGEVGLGRAVISGDLEVEGDLLIALEARHAVNGQRGSLGLVKGLVRLVHDSGAPLRPPAPPPEEVRMKGRRHSKRRDAAAVSHHYDVSNEFYRLLLGPTMAYSCAVWTSPDAGHEAGLDAAQERKFDLISRKLGLHTAAAEGREQRLLDVGCGWGGMLIHAALHYGVTGVGITLAEEQAELARKRIAEAGLSDRIEVRVQDYRDVPDGPSFDAISSIGMVEHVGEAQLPEYLGRLHDLLKPGGRLLNHGITWRYGIPAAVDPRGFMHRYIFPDAELPEIGRIVTAVQAAGFEARHVENLREHYALTLRAWLARLEENWDEAVEFVGVARARVWRLYIAGVLVGFEEHRTQIHQVLAVKLDDNRAGMPWRPDWV